MFKTTCSLKRWRLNSGLELRNRTLLNLSTVEYRHCSSTTCSFWYSARTIWIGMRIFGLKGCQLAFTEWRTYVHMAGRYIYIYIYEKFPVQLASVGLAQAHPNYHHKTKLYWNNWVCCCLYCYECAAWVTMPTATSDIFSGIAWYYGDNDFIIWTFNSLHIQMQCTWLAESDMDFHMTYSTYTDSSVTCNSKKKNCMQ